VDTKVVQEAVAPLANYQCVTVSHCGHAPQLEQPHIVNRLIVSFLSGQELNATEDQAKAMNELTLTANPR
jgi:hypothetical protein